jgi:hypothetical protein
MALLLVAQGSVRPPSDLAADFRTGDLPRVSVAEPLVRRLDLPAVADLLVEESELVSDAIADCGYLERGERVQVAGGQPSQSAVAQARLLFLLEQRSEVQAELRHGLPCRLLDPEVREAVAEVRPREELGRQVRHHLHVPFDVGLHGPHPSVEQGPGRRAAMYQSLGVATGREHGLT